MNKKRIKRMKEVNYLIAPAFIMALVIFSACEKNEAEEVIQNKTAEKTVNLPEESRLASIAKLISEIDVSIDMIKEINSGVTKSLEKGYDEDMPFTEILSPVVYPETTTRSDVGQNLFGKALLEKFNTLSGTRSTNFVTDLFDQLKEEGINLYWPYSDNWDGETMPVITFDPENEQDWNYAYTFSSFQSTTRKALPPTQMIVDEEYAIDSPVWVINETERVQEEWDIINPDISLEIDKPVAGVINNTPSTPSSTNVYSVYLGTLKISRQFDSWFRGGSEIIIQAGAPKNFEIKDNGNLTSLAMNTSYKKFYVSRKDIKKGIVHSLNYLIVGDWQDPLNEIGVMLHEEDPGSAIKEMNVKVSAEYKKVKGEFEIKFDMKKGDELISKQIYQRGFVFSTNNLLSSSPDNWYKDITDGAEWTLPYKIGKSTL
ncbi:hypothetical protein [Limibacterium fermenti]|uniref:hypothetical protein n=1 Tax=Limibacterium fermenti TaxID=3229863 RepID=UPI000E97A02F|nr:hypothetical protein [Porphyromonadaceae bacterium]